MQNDTLVTLQTLPSKILLWKSRFKVWAAKIAVGTQIRVGLGALYSPNNATTLTCLRVSTLAPTVVPKLFATSFAPTENARRNAATNPTINNQRTSFGIQTEAELAGKKCHEGVKNLQFCNHFCRGELVKQTCNRFIARTLYCNAVRCSKKHTP